jgi:hypothetical protein
VPGLDRRYARYVEETDGLLDAPSVVVIERIRYDLERQRREADALRRELGTPPVTLDDRLWQGSALDDLVVVDAGA